MKNVYKTLMMIGQEEAYRLHYNRVKYSAFRKRCLNQHQ